MSWTIPTSSLNKFHVENLQIQSCTGLLHIVFVVPSERTRKQSSFFGYCPNILLQGECIGKLFFGRASTTTKPSFVRRSRQAKSANDTYEMYVAQTRHTFTSGRITLYQIQPLTNRRTHHQQRLLDQAQHTCSTIHDTTK
jgi:hypothetical protein